MTREERGALMRDVVQREWRMFDKVHNAGGRADCQDDFETFDAMRTSQLSVWSDETVQSYHDDLVRAQAAGRNLLEEKYAYMMRSTAPEEFARIAGRLPEVSAQKQALVEEAVRAQVAEMERLRAEYPRFVGATMRALHTAEDAPDAASFETYLRGELCTYSQHTLRCYLRGLRACGGRYSRLLLQNTAALYGYASLAQLEAALPEA